MGEEMKKWFKTFLDSVGYLLLGLVLTAGAYAFVLGFFKMLWALYCETQVCARFRLSHEALFAAVNAIMSQSMLLFSLNSVALALKICLVIAFASQVFQIKRFIYDARGLFGKLLFFGIPCAAAVAYYSGASNREVYFAFCLLPTFNLMGYCFKFADVVIPSSLKL